MGRELNSEILSAILIQVRVQLDRAYEDARADGFDRPIFLVLDLRDANARAVARRCSGQIPIEAMVTRARQLGRRPNLIAALERATAIEVLAAEAPSLARGLVAPGPVGGYMAVVIGSGQGMVAEIRP